MGRHVPTDSAARQMCGNVAAVQRARLSPAKLRRRISMGDPASSGLAQQQPPHAVGRSASMPTVELSPIRSPVRRASSSKFGSPGKSRSQCSVMLQQSNGDVRRVRLARCRFADLVAAAVKDGELPRFYAVDATGERRRVEGNSDLEEIVKGANGCAPLVYVQSEPYPDYARTVASLRPPSSWDAAVYPGSPLSKLADVDSTVDRLRRPKPTNPYYDGIVGSLQENTASRPFLNDPDPDHPAFTSSRLRRSPILCAKQKRGIDTPLPYSLPSFGPAGGMDPRDAGHGVPKSSRLVHTRGTWTISVPTSKPAIDNRQRHPDVPDELTEFFKRTRLQKFEEVLRQLGMEMVDDLREISVRELREVGFQNLQIEKLSNELARLDHSHASKKKKSEQAQATEVAATIDAVASALPSFNSCGDFTQPLTTMSLRREEDQWDEFAELLLTDAKNISLQVTRFDASWADDPIRAREELEREAAGAAAQATRTRGDPGSSQEPELDKSAELGEDSDQVGSSLPTTDPKTRAPLRRSPSGVRGFSTASLEIQKERKGPKVIE
eukprot:COSAG02_NODE_4959_length_4781_cov_2.142674_1_plen_553_part_00